jgi:hypothetical protein
VQQLFRVERFRISCFPAPLTYSFDTQVGGRIYTGKDHVITFALLLVSESGDSPEPVASDRDDTFAYDMPLCCQRVKT